jgi:hypothetical protein
LKKTHSRSLKELKEIKLNDNQLEQLDPMLFRGLFNLESIYLQFNKFRNNTENKLELYLENKVQNVALYVNELWVQNNLNIIRNIVNHFLFLFSNNKYNYNF